MTGINPDDIAHLHRVGVVVERRTSENPWADGTWQVTEVLSEVPGDETWRPLLPGEGCTRFFAGALDIELFKRETEAYKMNLSQEAPAIYVVLRPGENDDEPDVVPFLATISPYEAEDYTESGEMIVDAVPMPESLIAWVHVFVDAFHVDVPFKKRKQRRKSDSATGRGTDTFARFRRGR